MSAGSRDVDKMPKVTRRNVLILKYYSFENYFLNPEIMVKIGILDTEDSFYDILFDKMAGISLPFEERPAFYRGNGRGHSEPSGIRENMEAFKIYMRGHNLYDIFYGRYKNGRMKF